MTLRSDARRNRELIINAACDAFASDGVDVGVEEIARRAGVGMGTLYRRFPTKEELVRAIIAQRLAELEPITTAALASDDPGQGFHDVLCAAVRLVAMDHGLLQVLAERVGQPAQIPAVRELFYEPLAELLARAQGAGQIRPDIGAEDLQVIARMASAAVHRLPGDAADADAWPRHLELLLDGLAPQPGAADRA